MAALEAIPYETIRDAVAKQFDVKATALHLEGFGKHVFPRARRSMVMLLLEQHPGMELRALAKLTGIPVRALRQDILALERGFGRGVHVAPAAEAIRTALGMPQPERAARARDRELRQARELELNLEERIREANRQLRGLRTARKEAKSLRRSLEKEETLD